VAARLTGRVQSLRYLHWPDGKRDGWDLRDEIIGAFAKKQPERCWKQLRDCLRETPRKQPESVDGGDVNAGPALVQLKREWVYAYQTKRFIYIGTDADRNRAFYELDKESFSDRHAELFPNDMRERAAARQMLASGCTKVAQPAYLPNQPQLTTEQIKGAVVPVVNLWIPSDVQFKPGDIERYHQHVAYVIPDKPARDTFYDWFSFLLRNPGQKANWAPVLGGRPGIGKDLVVWAVAQALGKWNVTEPGPVALEHDHNDFLRHAKLVVVDTMHFRGKQGRALLDRIKQWIASPPERIRINGKWLVQHDIANIVSFFFMTNSDDALALDPHDRRFFVYWSAVRPHPKEKYYPRLWDWMREHVGALGHYFLNEHKVSAAFNPLTPPPMTDAKQHMIDANESPLLQTLRASWTEERPPLSKELIVVNDIIHWFKEERHRTYSEQEVTTALRTMGASFVRQVRMEGQRPRVWAMARVAHYRRMSAQEFTQEYRHQKRTPGAVRSQKKAIRLVRAVGSARLAESEPTESEE
jgi:hypothetical protein